MIGQRGSNRGPSAADIPLGVESAFPNAEQPRLAKIEEERPRAGLFSRALSWFRRARSHRNIS
jgi:hypothetical protein